MSMELQNVIEEREHRTRKLPLWKEWIRSNTFNYGDTWKIADLERYFGVARDSFKFRREIIPIQRYLRGKGMVLSEAGQSGVAFTIRPVETNAHTTLSMVRKGINMIFESVVLADATPRELLTSEQVNELDHAAEKAATTASLIARGKTAKALKI